MFMLLLFFVLFFKQSVFVAHMLTDALSDTKNTHLHPLFHEFPPRFHPSKAVLIFLSVSVTLAIDTLTPKA